jgi:replicative DNA helicase
VIDVEEAVIGSILLDPDCYDRAVSQGLEDRLFTSVATRTVYKSIREILDSGKNLDLVILVEHMRSRGSIMKGGGEGFVSGMVDQLPNPNGIEDYVDMMKDTSREVAFRKWLLDIHRKMDRSDRSMDEIISTAEMDLSVIAKTGTGTKGISSARDIMIPLVADIEDGLLGGSSLSTGFADLDLALGGLSNGCLYIAAGRPGMGKTSFALNIGQQVATDPDDPRAVGVISLEMSNGELGLRMLSFESRIPMTDIRRGTLTDEEWKELVAAQRKVGNAPIYIDDSGASQLHKLINRAKRMRAENKIELLIVDYIQLCSTKGGGGGNRVNEVSEISRGLKLLAKTLDIPVIAVSQLSRGVESRPNKRPMLSDLRDSGAIEQDADAVMFLYREGYYHPDKVDPVAGEAAELNIAKHRHGAVGRVKLAWDREITRFDDYIAPMFTPRAVSVSSAD